MYVYIYIYIYVCVCIYIYGSKYNALTVNYYLLTFFLHF